MKPTKIVYFICFVFLLLFLVMAIMPSGGYTIYGDFKLKFPTLAGFFIPEHTEKKDISFIIEDIPTESLYLNVSLDSHSDSLQMAVNDSLRQTLSKIQYPGGDRSILYSFFEKLNLASTSKSRVRIMHYGDSQLEGDRITGIIRQKLQGDFSGDGPGMFPIIPVSTKDWSNNKYSDNWKRYTGFGNIDTSVNHKNYGALLTFSRFTDFNADSLRADTAFHYAWFEITPSSRPGSKSSIFREITMFYDNCTMPVFIQVFKDNELVREDLLPVSNVLSQYKIVFDSPASTIKFTFKTKISPDILGFSISSPTGIIADNIPIRGGSGTEFSKINREHLSRMLNMLQPDLFIMQFGGNVLPYIDSEKECKDYGEWLEAHLRLIKKMIPKADVILIGPADMSIKEGDEYITHPFLEQVRDALKNAAFNTGSAYWDMYEAMGGKNSMPLWVDAEPALAAKDYIHFSTKGASKIAGMFYETFSNDYKKWKQKHKNEKTIP
ncbi:MAG: hypothetical protein H0V01_01825 [Bacteroidetes bacterium]|nr:hypothetical protein [Bacteroidota bacterium]HET6243281.1 hypothetical protein [Bacteroidia bacterium]